MNTSLTRSAARIYGTLSELGGDSTDVLSRLLPFFEPILRPLQGHRFEVDEFAASVRDTWKWNFNSDVVEVFVPHLVAAGWLTPDSAETEPTTYSITLPDTDFDDPAHASAKAELRSLAEQFKSFSEELSPLTAIPKTVEEFEEILIEWLLYIEAFSEKNLEFNAKVEKSDSGTMQQVVEVPRTTKLKSEEKFLCARFVEEAIRTQPETGERLARIASIGLLTEVVQDFVKPTTPVETSNLVVYLDAPVAMELLGVSGKASKENTLPVVNELQRIGANVRVFGQSIEEIRRSLHAVLNNPRPTGPTAQALARGEVLKDYVAQIQADPESFLNEFNISVTHRTLDQTPSEHQYFPDEYWQEIYGSLVFQQNMTAREHDSDVVTLVMRQRRGHTDRDIFRSRFVLVTRNGLVAQLTRKMCVDLGVISPGAVPPVVHRRFLTASIWLRTGLGSHDLEVPKRLLLANCERVLAIRPGVVEAVKKLTDDLGDAEKAKQLDLLIGQHRSTQALMDKTLGTASVVTSDNIAELFQEMIHPHLEEERDRSKEAVKAERKKGDERVKKVRNELAEVKIAELAAKKQYEDKVAEDKEAVSALCEYVEGSLAGARKQRRTWALLVAALLVLPMLLAPSSNWKWLSLAIAFFLTYLSVTGSKLIGVTTPKAIAMNALNEAADDRGIAKKLSQFSVEWHGESFTVIDPPQETVADNGRLI